MGGFRLAWLLLPFLAALVSAQDCLPYIQQKNVNLTWVGSDPPSCSSCSAPNAQYFNNTKCSGDSDWNIGLNEFSVDLPPNSIVVQINAVAFANPTCAVGSSCTLGFLIQRTYLIVFDTPENASPDSCDLCTIQFTAQPPPTFCSGVSGFNYTNLNDVRIFTTFDSLCISAAQLQIFYIQAVPQVASVFPTSIPVSTDEVIAITGSDFTPTANLNCYLNGKVYPTTFVDYKKITCTIPGFASTTNENFSLAIGNSSATLFTAQVLFYVVPTVTSLSPDRASSHGIAAVFLTGSSFFDGDDMVCKFGSNKAVQAQYVNSTCVKCVNPLDSSCTASYVNVTFSPNGEDFINVPGQFYFTGCETPLPTPSSSPSPGPSSFPSQTPQPTPDPSPSAAPTPTAHNKIDLPDNFWYYFAIAMLLILIIIVFAISIVYMKRKKPPRRKPRAVLFDGTDESNTYGSTSSSGGGGGPGSGGNGHDSLTNLLLNDPNTVQMSELSAWREIEKGSFGVIYQATWRGTTIAVKKLPSKMIEREFHREAALMRSLRHPNVLQYLGTAVSKTEICILMEYMAQGSLYRLLHDPSSSFVHERMRSICIDTAKGMNYLHQQDPPIIHRDLKSHNLLVDEHWRVKVCDFGLSRFYQANATMTACGTPSWTAPEVLRNERYTTKADVYGFGVVVWEMLARRDPFPGMPPFQIVFAVGTQGLRPSIDEDWDPRWVHLLQNCWAEDPKKRPNFEQILSILESMRD